ncbi:uncharacterized protein [Henckelia pumila]|uniref:uncharacterized protein n=1 Tax=Henckelia pumila TaxID=405737 RepID=UPI003C6E1F0E
MGAEIPAVLWAIGAGVGSVVVAALCAVTGRSEFVREGAAAVAAWMKMMMVLRLTKNMRLQNLSPDEECDKIKQFSDWIANIGVGKIGESNDGYATIDIPDELLLKDSNDPIASIVESTFPSSNISISVTAHFQQRAILAPTLDVVQFINEYMISQNYSERRLYLSSDMTCQSNRNIGILHDVHTPEYLNGLRCS